MSLETLLEAARYVEQQELRAKQLQQPHFQPHIGSPIHGPHSSRPSTLKIVSPVPPISTHSQQPQLSQSPPAALVAVPSTAAVSQVAPLQSHQPLQPLQQLHQHSQPLGQLLQVQQQPHALVAQTNGLLGAQRTPGQVTQVPAPALVAVPAQTQPVVEVVQKPAVAAAAAATVLPVQPTQAATITNGFEKPNSIVLEDGAQHLQQPQQQQQQQDLKKRSHVPSVIRSGTREVHNKLEKNRRAHLKECFELLKKQLPPQQDEKKSSNLSILHSALRYIQVLKKKERENEHEMERLAREKIAAQQRLAALKKELGAQWDNIDFTTLVPDPSVANTPTSAGMNINTSASVNVNSPPAVGSALKEERISDSEDPTTRAASATTPGATPLQPAQLSVHLPLPQVGYPMGQGLVVGLHKVALVSKSLPVTHIIAAPPQLNGKVVPLMNAQYLMKPVVVVSSPSAPGTTISPRPS